MKNALAQSGLRGAVVAAALTVGAMAVEWPRVSIAISNTAGKISALLSRSDDDYPLEGGRPEKELLIILPELDTKLNAYLVKAGIDPEAVDAGIAEEPGTVDFYKAKNLKALEAMALRLHELPAGFSPDELSALEASQRVVNCTAYSAAVMEPSYILSMEGHMVALSEAVLSANDDNTDEAIANSSAAEKVTELWPGKGKEAVREYGNKLAAGYIDRIRMRRNVVMGLPLDAPWQKDPR